MTREHAEPRARILIVEDDPALLANVAELLNEEGFDVIVADNGADGVALARGREPELVICDIMLPVVDGYGVLKAVREFKKTAHVPFVFLTAKAERSEIRLGMNLGADDYLTKPFLLSELLDAVRTRLRRADELSLRTRAALQREAESSRQKPVPGFTHADGVVVHDPVMLELYAQVERAAASNINVLILGETGVGKELLARAVHNSSPRRTGPFLALNCAALTESLLESELFGNEKGAFTGAVQARAGLLETAAGGTIFLDEVGELPPSIQGKLLRVLEERRVLRLGARQHRDVDVRFVAATHRDLEQAVLRQAFREDLYYRLNGISFTIPPLRSRLSEIEPLSRMFLARAVTAQGRLHSHSLGVEPDFLLALQRYPWPGNLRELRNAIERAVVLCEGDVLLRTHLPPKVLEARSSAKADANPTSAFAQADDANERRAHLRRELEQIERERIARILEETQGNQTLAAERLGVSRRTLVYKLTALGLPRPRRKG